MPVDTYNFSTGPSTLPDVGSLIYNGCLFSPLYETKVSGKVIKDNANRTTKYMEYTLVADGYVTLPAGHVDIGPTMRLLQQYLTAHGGQLIYKGRGFDLVVNTKGRGVDTGGRTLSTTRGPDTALSTYTDVAW